MELKYLWPTLIVFTVLMTNTKTVSAFLPQQDNDLILLTINQPESVERDSVTLTLIFKLWDNTLPAEDTKFIDSCKKFLNYTLNQSQWEKAKAYSLYLYGMIFISENKLYNAFDYLERSMLEFKELKDDYNYNIVNNKFVPLMNWNMIENNISEDSKIKYATYIKDALTKAEEIDNRNIIGNIKITLASYYIFVLKDYNEALKIILKIYPLLGDPRNPEWFDYYYITQMGEALCYLNSGEEAKGKAIINRIIKACDSHPDLKQALYVRGQIAAFIGRFYLSKEKYKEAYKYASEAEKGVDFLNFPYFTNYLNKTLYEAYKYNNQPEAALVYLEKVKNYTEQAEADKLNQKFAEWQFIYDSELQKSKIRDLENKNLIQTQQRNKLIENALIIILLLTMVSIAYFIISRNKLRQKNIELKQKNEEISKAILKGQNQERKRVASELHDNLNTKIAALKWRFEALESNLPNEQIKSLIKILDDVYLDIRLISHNLIPEELEISGIEIAVLKLIKNLSNPQIKFSFISNGLETRPPIHIEYQVYNIILELINNVIKHSSASQCWISLSNDKEELILSVSDNGKGLKNEANGQGVGLRNIKSRVAHLNGKIKLYDPQIKGFKVSISIPNRESETVTHSS